MPNEIIENPVVGKFYQVPCAYLKKRNVWHPIIPILHNDKQFGTENSAYNHYHYDLRFMSDSYLLKYFPHEFDNYDIGFSFASDIPLRMNTIYIQDYEYWKTNPDHNWKSKWEFKRRKCFRTFTGIVILRPVIIKKYPKISKWYQDQIGKSCKGRICPHRQAPMIERDGVLECPMHGLIGCKDKEIIIGNIHNI